MKEPDRKFHNSRAKKSANRPILCNTESSIDKLGNSKVMKCLVGKEGREKLEVVNLHMYYVVVGQAGILLVT